MTCASSASAATSPVGTATPAAAPSTIADVLATDPHPLTALQLGSAAGDGIVLGYEDGFADVLHESGILSRLPLDRAATAITDPQRVIDLLRRGLGHSREQIRHEQQRATGQRIAHDKQLRQIRDYAIARYKDDDICRDGLDAFLKQFELDVYEPTIRVRYTITGSYLVRGPRAGTEELAERDARGYIRVDLSQVDDVVDDTSEFTLDVDSADELTDDA
jgi:hypothetical protein